MRYRAFIFAILTCSVWAKEVEFLKIKLKKARIDLTRRQAYPTKNTTALIGRRMGDGEVIDIINFMDAQVSYTISILFSDVYQ